MNDQLKKLLGHSLTVPVAVGATAFGSGLGLGYVLGRRPKKFELHALPEQLHLDFQEAELAEIKADHPANLTLITDNSESQEEIVEKLGENFISQKIKVLMTKEEDESWAQGIKVAMTTPVDVEEPDVIVTTYNVFAQNDDDWDYETEVENRKPELPYILHQDEFFEDEKGFTQITLTYYESDDIMADEDDTPVYNYSQLIGELKFGHGSKDPNTFHVRNEQRQAEYEILRHTGSFAEEIMGLEIENEANEQDLQHSHNRKFRDTD